MKRFLNIFSVIAVLLAVIFLFLVSSISHFGITPYSYSNGTLIYVSPITPEELVQGDKVIYLLGEDSGSAVGTVQEIDLTKGLFFIDESELSYGDNTSQGKLVPFDISAIIGKQLFEVPILGYVVNYISTKTGFAVFLGVIAFFIIVAFLTTPPAKAKEKKTVPADGIVRGRRKEVQPSETNEIPQETNDQ